MGRVLGEGQQRNGDPDVGYQRGNLRTGKARGVGRGAC